MEWNWENLLAAARTAPDPRAPARAYVNQLESLEPIWEEWNQSSWTNRWHQLQNVLFDGQILSWGMKCSAQELLEKLDAHPEWERLDHFMIVKIRSGLHLASCTPELVDRLWQPLTFADRKACFLEPTFWPAARDSVPVLWRAWEQCAPSDQKDLLPTVIKRLAYANHVPDLAWAIERAKKLGLTLDECQLDNALAKCVLCEAKAAQAFLHQTYKPDLSKRLKKWVHSNDASLADDYFRGLDPDSFMGMYAELKEKFPDWPWAKLNESEERYRSLLRLKSLSEVAASGPRLRSSHRHRS